MLNIVRREQWTAFSTYKMWQTMLGITTKQSRNHNILAETFSSILTSKFTQLLDDMQRIYKKVSLILWCLEILSLVLAIMVVDCPFTQYVLRYLSSIFERSMESALSTKVLIINQYTLCITLFEW